MFLIFPLKAEAGLVPTTVVWRREVSWRFTILIKFLIAFYITPDAPEN